MTADKHKPELQPYYRLSPDAVIDAVESTGLVSDYRVIALNSFENRVYQIGIEEAEPVVVKFYRPGRWSNQQILEEHSFSQQLVDADLPVVAPTVIKGATLHESDGYRFTVYPRRGGYPISVDDLDVLFRMGQYLGRLHGWGARELFTHRETLQIQQQMTTDLAFLAENFIPPELQAAHSSICEDLLATVNRLAAELPPLHMIRIHGDCHPGNMLWRDDKLWIVDLDDCINGPALQDVWMLLSGSRNEQEQQLNEIIEGYNEFNDFPSSQLGWMEILRTRRMVHQAAWVGRRWQDPAFPQAFTWFNTTRYWSDHVLELREQLAALAEPPLRIWS